MERRYSLDILHLYRKKRYSKQFIILAKECIDYDENKTIYDFLRYPVLPVYDLTFPTAAKSTKIPKKLTLNRKEILLYPGESKKLIVEKVKPAGASAKVSWKAKKQRVATVSANGRVTAKKPGKTTITATAKKNPRIQAVVQITVKKPPVKREKTCEFQGKFHKSKDAVGVFFYYKMNFSDKDQPDKIVIRSKEEFQEIKRIWKKYSKVDFKETGLEEYKNLDFKSESLVLLRCSSPYTDTFCMTKFDGTGKLRGIVKIQSAKAGQDNHGTILAISDYLLILRMNRKDEAMIDYFEFEKVE